jgi:hypothetical protein
MTTKIYCVAKCHLGLRKWGIPHDSGFHDTGMCQAVNAWSSVIACGMNVVLICLSCLFSWREDIRLQYSDKACANDSGLLGSDTVAGLVFATYYSSIGPS